VHRYRESFLATSACPLSNWVRSFLVASGGSRAALTCAVPRSRQSTVTPAACRSPVRRFRPLASCFLCELGGASPPAVREPPTSLNEAALSSRCSGDPTLCAVRFPPISGDRIACRSSGITQMQRSLFESSHRTKYLSTSLHRIRRSHTITDGRQPNHSLHVRQVPHRIRSSSQWEFNHVLHPLPISSFTRTRPRLVFR